jgi:hypothetical protein
MISAIFKNNRHHYHYFFLHRFHGEYSAADFGIFSREFAQKSVNLHGKTQNWQHCITLTIKVQEC